MAATIYRITNNLTNDFYIGKTTITIHSRFHRHKALAKAGSPCHLHRALRKYGSENFSVALVEEVDNAISSEREIYWISTLHPQYNMTSGGESAFGNKYALGHKHSPETLTKMSEAKMGNKHRLGHTHSSETRTKMSKSHKLYWDTEAGLKRRLIFHGHIL